VGKVVENELKVPLTNHEENNFFQVQDILNSYMAKESLVMPFSANMLETIKKEEPMKMQELTADALQAVKVEQALVSTGTNPQEAKEQAIKILTQVESKKGITEILRKKSPQPPMETKFEYDSKADKNRSEIVTEAIGKIDSEVEMGRMEKITGKAVAEIMPTAQPESVKSEILSPTQSDGSYENLIVDLSKIGELRNEASKQEIDGLIRANHAVKLGNIDQATEKEVKKVLKGEFSL
jgi:hypothetical protein